MESPEYLGILFFKGIPREIQRSLLNRTMKTFKPINNLPLKIVFVLFLFVMCKYSTESIYVISREDSLRRLSYTRGGTVLTPPTFSYSRFNFFIDSKGNIYFYSFPEPIKAKGVFDEIKPDDLYIMRSNLIKVPKGKEQVFFNERVLKIKTNEKIKTITIASVNDTIKGSFVKYLVGLKNDQSNHVSLSIRRTLSNENEVLMWIEKK